MSETTAQSLKLPWKRFVLSVSLCTLIFFAVLLIAPLLGSTRISIVEAFTFPDGPDGQIFFVARLPRILLGMLTGGALAVSGVALQALLRNPLATPFTLGVSSGASLGAVIALFLGLHQTFLGYFAPSACALLGALLTSLIVYTAASVPGRPIKTTTLLLAGVCLSFCLSAAVMLVHYLANMATSQAILRWLMGGLAITDASIIVRTALPAGIGVALIWIVAPELNILAGGSEIARSRGVDVAKTQRFAYLGAAFATASVVAVTGPIGFIGLVIPHSLRLIVGPDHRILIPCSALIGGAFLVMCDCVARLIIAPSELPVGVLTAMIGGPFLVWLIRTRTL